MFDQYLGTAGTGTVPGSGPVTGVVDNPFLPDSPAPTKQNVVAATADTKKAALAQTADAKKADVVQQNGVPSLDQLYSSTLARNSGVGNQTLPTQELADLNNMSPYDLAKKYGFDRAQDMLNGQLQAQGATQTDINTTRSLPQAAGDFATGVGLGIANSVGGVAALGAGIVNKRAGVAAAQGIKALNDVVQQNLQSDGMNAHRQLNAARNELGFRDNADEEARTKETDGAFVAGLRRIAKDGVTAVGNAVSDPTVASDGLAQGVGSLLTAGPIGRGIVGVADVAGGKLVRRALVEGAMAADAGATGASALLGRAATSPLGSKVLDFAQHEGATMAGIGATEAGGAYQQNASDVMNTSFEDLAKTSPLFNRLAAKKEDGGEGMSFEEARQTVANRSGLWAAAIQAPLATATGGLVAKFESAPLKIPTLRQLGQNILKEGLEETIQSGTGQAAQNVATKQTSNENKDLLEGVGEQAGLGGLYGMASAGAVSGPGSILSSGTRAALGVGNKAVELAGKRGDRIMAENEAKSPVSDQAVSTAAQEAVQNAPAAAQAATDAINNSDLTPSQKEEAHSYVEAAKGVVHFDSAETQGMPDVIQRAAAGQTSRIHFFQNLANEAKNPKNSAQEQALALATLNDSINNVFGENGLNFAGEDFKSLPDDHAAKQFSSQVGELLTAFQQSPAGKTAANTERAEKVAQRVAKDTLTEQHFDSPEGQQAVQANIAAAQISPQNSNRANNELILNMAAAGKITLDNRQSAALRTANAILDGQKAYIEQLKKTGLKSSADLVSEKVTVNQGSAEGEESALEHTNAIRAAYGRGDTEGAKTALLGFQKFVQSQQNKIRAVNAQIAAHGGNANPGNALHYDAARQDKSGFTKSQNPFGVSVRGKRAASSIGFVQQVAAESHALTGIHNALATAFPELGVKHLAEVSLDPSLADAHPSKVAKEFADGVRGKKEAPASQSSESTVQDEAPKQPVTSEKPAAKDAVKETAKPVESVNKDLPAAAPVEDTPSLEDERDDLINRKIDGPLTPQEEARLSEINRRLNPGQASKEVVQKYAAKRKYRIVGEADQQGGLASTYPTLIHFPTGNMFVNAFKFPSKPITKFSGEENPLEQVQQALHSGSAFTHAAGIDGTNLFTPKVAADYQAFLRYVPKIIAAMNAQIPVFLDKGNNQKDFDEGTKDINRYKNGKLMNLVEEGEDGVLRLNQQLAEGAALAGLQWLLEARQKASHYNNEDVARIFGVPLDTVDENGPLATFLQSGTLRIDAYSDLAQKIQEYWGLTKDADADVAYSQGIPQAMAAEVIKALDTIELKTGENKGQSLTNPETMVVDTSTGQPVPFVRKEGQKLPKGFREVEIFRIQPATVFKGVAAMPDAIERVVMTKPKQIYYMDGAVPVNSDEQMRNPGVKLTDEQQEMVGRESSVPHTLDMETVNLMEALNAGGNLLKIFGPGESDSEKLNKNDAISKKGQALSITSAFDAMRDLVAVTRAQSAATGKPMEEIEHRYGYGVSKVGRLQMLGAFNPQASKLMRHVILPTLSTLNMLRGEHIRAFDLGVAQGIGIKVHNMPYTAARNQMLDALNGKYAPAVDVLRAYLKGGKLGMETADIEKLSASLGSGASFAQLYALKEYARLLNAQEAGEDLSQFKTKLYLEADGMTNGPIMAMAMFARGHTDVQNLENMSRGGLYYGGLPFQNSTIQRTIDPTDLYKATANVVNTRFADKLSDKDMPADMKGQLTHVLRLMNVLLGNKVIEFDGENVTMQRDLTKNPLTVTMYASGAGGIANKLVSMLTDAMYQQMSVAMQNEWGADQIFGPDQAKKNADFNESLRALREFVPEWNKKERKYALTKTKNTLADQALKDYTLGSGDLQAMSSNLKTLFVSDLRSAIKQVVGNDTFVAMDMVKTATQVQSIVQQHMFEAKVKRAVQERIDSKDPTYRTGDFLSQKQLDAIKRSMAGYSPLIKAPGQTFFLSGQNKVGLAGASFASSLSGSHAVPATVNGPGNIGVAGTASLNIGMGDGKMIQTFSNDPDTDPRRLLIFDGIHLALDQIYAGSEQANRAVWNTWMGNPLKAVSQSFDSFMTNIPATEVTKGSDLHRDLVAALFGPFNATDEKIGDFPPEVVMEELQKLQGDLQLSEKQVDARHRAMNRVNVSVDHLASAASPYQITDKEMVVGSPEQVAQRLSEITQEEYAKIRAKEKKDPSNKTESIPTELAKWGEAVEGGARSLTMQAVHRVIENVLKKVPRDQATVLQSIQKTLAAEGYSLIHGTREQLLAYNASLGANMIDASRLTDENVHGFTMTGRQEIWLVSPSSETLAHELIHAATIRKVQAFYNGEDLGPNSQQVTKAIQNLEVLMQQFLNLGDLDQEEGGLDAMPREMQVAYNHAQSAINAALSDMNLDPATRKAAALNEYMAWGLANTQLTNLQKKVESHWLVQMAKDVVNAIRQIVFGKDKPMAPENDMFSNLLFNTQVVMAAQIDLPQIMSDTTLYQSTQYGTNDHLTELGNSFDETITKWIVQADGDVKEMLRRHFNARYESQDRGARMADNFATVFPMTLQEKTTFHQIVAGLTSEAQFDPTVLARMQQLWSQVNQHLTADMMEDPNEPDANQRRHDAQAKVDAIRGDLFAEEDSKGRSTLLPTFVALAMTNDQFRQVLANLLVEKQGRSRAESRVDRALENLATDVLDSLGRRISGEGKSRDVLAAMDAMGDRFMDIAQERETAMDRYLRDSGGLVDSANDYMVQGMDALSRFLVRKTGEWDQAYDNKLTNAVASSARLFGAIVSEDQAGHVAEGLLAATNKIKAFKPFTDIIHDMIGRVASNAQVYDMIKTVRSMIQKTRQQFREEVPSVIEAQFSRKLEEHEWDLLHKGMGRADLASLSQGMTQDQVLELARSSKARKAKIAELEDQIKALDKPNFDIRQKKMKELARYMMTGETASHLLRNATAITRMVGMPGWEKQKSNPALTKPIDMLTSLYALEELSAKETADLAGLVTSQEKGMKFALSYLQGQRKDEMSRADSSERALLNHFKGYIPQVQQAGASLIVADDSEYANLTNRSYVRIGDYKGSNVEPGKTKKGYYFMPVNGRQAFQQGNLQNVRQTAGGVDVASGYSQMQSAGRITDANAVKRIESMVAIGAEKGNEHLMPVFNHAGEVVAYERALNPEIVNSKLKFNTQLHQMLGVWRGRQVEEELSAVYNNELIDKLADMYDTDLNESKANAERYINVFDQREQAKDPVLKDAVALITPAMKRQIEQKFGKQFWIRRDMLNDVLGYRSASVGDAWTGNSRWSEDTQKHFQRIAMSVFGNKAYRYAVNAERTFQNLVSDMKTMIVVKSVVVPVANLVSNAYQLAGRGVPIKDIITGMPKKTAEVKAYVANELRRIEADAELRAAEGRRDAVAVRKLRTEIQSIEDSHKRLSIWPLIQAGEFSAVSDGKATAEEIELTSGRLHGYIEQLVDKLPPGIKTAGRYALITKDTALFQGMQTAVEYGDFLAKAILYDDLTKRKKQSQEYALARVTEEYVNYDRLPGRFRGYMESMGLMWFYNFKIRSAKVALSMIRNNPVHALLAGLVPAPSFLGSIGTPLTDNLFAKLADGQISYSFGFGQLFHAPTLNPWVNLFSN
jgi:hypothetical protein